MKLILTIILIISLTGCKLAHTTYNCDHYGCGNIIPAAPEIKIPTSIDSE